MRIAILGTRGIPNNYGGFEQNAENLGPLFVRAGHDVTVYNPDDHPYREAEWNGVRIRRVFCSERRLKLGIWGTLLYDFLCLRHAIAEGADVILELGYVPSAAFFWMPRRRHTRLITNMDGLEWKRSKWNAVLKRFVRYCEGAAVHRSDALIADNPGIQEHLRAGYGRDSTYIPYGADLCDEPSPESVERLGLRCDAYSLLIARLEPENNVELILDGYAASGVDDPFVVVGRTETRYGRHLTEKYRDARVRFLGGVYDLPALNALRWHATLYFHGHSVGGTNPSLLEAMAANAHIAAFDCVFNRHILGSDAHYFRTAEDVRGILRAPPRAARAPLVRRNRQKLHEEYNWERVGEQYLDLLERVAHDTGD